MKTKAAILLVMTMLLSACCNKQLLVEDGHEALSYYVCSQCSIPYGTMICETLPQEEDNG